MYTFYWPAIIAIPARNEADRIVPCLRALAQQQGPPPPPPILVLVNDSDDGTAAVIDNFRPNLPATVDVTEHSFPAAREV